jgi:hypothetical protein
MAMEDTGGQPWRVDFQYRRIRAMWHGLRWSDPSDYGPHLEDPFRL